jgi:hypothetical protein
LRADHRACDYPVMRRYLLDAASFAVTYAAAQFVYFVVLGGPFSLGALLTIGGTVLVVWTILSWMRELRRRRKRARIEEQPHRAPHAAGNN